MRVCWVLGWKVSIPGAIDREDFASGVKVSVTCGATQPWEVCQVINMRNFLESKTLQKHEVHIFYPFPSVGIKN